MATGVPVMCCRVMQSHLDSTSQALLWPCKVPCPLDAAAEPLAQSHTCTIRKLDLQDASTRQFNAGAIEAYAIDGKPADCTMLALHGPLFQAGNTLHLLKAVSPVVGLSMQRMLTSMLWSQLTYALLFQSQNFDLVVSGINRGDNLGLHVIYSGTVGAAQEAAIKVFLPIAPKFSCHTILSAFLV